MLNEYKSELELVKIFLDECCNYEVIPFEVENKTTNFHNCVFFLSSFLVKNKTTVECILEPDGDHNTRQVALLDGKYLTHPELAEAIAFENDLLKIRELLASNAPYSEIESIADSMLTGQFRL